MKRFSIFLLFLIVGCALNAQDDYRNYVLSRTMLNGTGTSYLDNITYYDGLGRPFQTVEKAVQSGLPVNKNLATLQEYDAAGREWNSWLQCLPVLPIILLPPVSRAVHLEITTMTAGLTASRFIKLRR